MVRSNYYNDKTVIFLDGNWVKAKEATTSVFSQTLHYGIGAFEGIRAYQTPSGLCLFKAGSHFRRLLHSLEVLNIKIPYAEEELFDITQKLLQKNNLRNAYVRPLVYMDEDMRLTPARKAHVMIAAWEWGQLLGSGELNLTLSTFYRPEKKSLPVTAKLVGNYTNGILASQEARAKGFDEALMFDVQGNIAQAPGANFFLERDGELYTSSSASIMAGITRKVVMEYAKELGVKVHEQAITVDMIHEADSAFLTGTATEVVSVRSIEGEQMKLPWEDSIGSQLAEIYQHRIRNDDYQTMTIV
ncbi:MAG: branched-chain amino acid transaminase [Cyclobacteriaceae bacterium]|nr:branched-chain amino acid transaminase [Cyclobacteriaceae bacterium]